MRTENYLRETVAPNEERRRVILRKLAGLRGLKKAEHIVRPLRRELQACHGYTRYYRIYKNIQIPLCDGDVSRKYLKAGKDGAFMQPVVQKFRQKFKNTPIVNERYHELREARMALRYRKVGGVMLEPGYFFKENRRSRTRKVTFPKRPTTKDFYIGLEIEYASTQPIEKLTEMIADAGLHDHVRVMRDGSIRTNDIYKFQVEFCILAKYSEVDNILKRLKPIIFDRPDMFSPNDSCGLHVHLDARNGREKQIFRNLASMQQVLFQLAKENRRENRYCAPVYDADFDDGDHNDHYSAISRSSYHKHGTIECRIHHSTLSLTQISNWVKLLKTVADYNGGWRLEMGTFTQEFEQLKNVVKLEPELIKYIEERNVV